MPEEASSCGCRGVVPRISETGTRKLRRSLLTMIVPCLASVIPPRRTEMVRTGTGTGHRVSNVSIFGLESSIDSIKRGRVARSGVAGMISYIL